MPRSISPSLRGLEGEAVSAPTGRPHRGIAELALRQAQNTTAHERLPETSIPQPVGCHWLSRNSRLAMSVHRPAAKL